VVTGRPRSVSLDLGYSKAVEKLGPEYRAQIKGFETKLMKGLDSPGLHIEPIHGCKVDGIRSGRVNDDIRVILLIDPLTLLYVDHHEQAYEWARKREISTSDDGRKVTVYEPVPEGPGAPTAGTSASTDMFRRYDDDYLVDVIGVPRQLIPPLRGLADSSEILELLGRIPEVVVERLIDIAEGRIPEIELPIEEGPVVAEPDEPEVVDSIHLDEDTQQSLDLVAVSDRRQWLEFIGAKQKRLAQDHYDRPVVLTGPAGTGKTVVLMHRAATMAKLGKRVLLTTIGKTLATSMSADLDLLAKGAPWRRKIEVLHLHELIQRLRQAAAEAGMAVPTEYIVYRDGLDDVLEMAAHEVRGDESRSKFWYLDEWNLVLEPQAIVTLEQYLEAPRPGRGVALQRGERQREWPVFERAVELLREQGSVPLRHVVAALLAAYRDRADGLPRWSHVLVDELQDFGPACAQLMLLLAEDPSGVLFAGDTSQRLYVPPIDYGELGVDVLRRRLTRSHRTTEAIRRFVEVDLALRDKADRSTGSRSGGQEPEVHHFETEAAEFAWIADRCARWQAEGQDLADVGIAVRDKAAAQRMVAQLKKRAVPCHLVQAGSVGGHGVSVLHYHLAKGLEFNTVVVAQLTSDCLEPDKYDWMPDDQRSEKLAIRHNLIYVALTRAREQLVVTCGGVLPERLEGHRLVVAHGPSEEPLGDEGGGSDEPYLDDIPF